MSRKKHENKSTSIPKKNNQIKKYSVDELLELGEKENRIKLVELENHLDDNKFD